VRAGAKSAMRHSERAKLTRVAGLTCRVCDLENAGGARFCSACGAALVAEQHGDALVGKTIAGKFRIEKLLGNGAMGRVYQATHVALDRGVAIKVMHDHLARSSEFATRFVREARAASKLDHPNSIRVLDFGRTDAGEGQLLYLVMELFVGSDLYGLLRDEGPLEIARAGKIVGQVLSALEDAHAIRLIHRDLKPENVLVGKRPDGTELAKLCDFGIAKVAQEEGPKLSQAGSMIGTPLYMSPEAACGRDADARSDLYSVAVMLYEVMTGSRPFDAASPLEVARLQVEEQPEPPTRRAPERNLPPALERVILRGLAKAPNDRWQSAREFREALESALGAGNVIAERVATMPCRGCGTAMPTTSRFCPSCGTPAAAARMPVAPTSAPKITSKLDEGAFSSLAGVLPDRLLGDLRRAQAEARSERRTLAVLAVDLIGIEDAGDPEELAGRIGDRFELARRVLERFGALVQGAGGTRLTAMLGVDARPDEVEGLVPRAVEAAFAVRRECGNARWFRGAIASGIFLVTDGPSGPNVLGAAAQKAAQHLELARPGEIVVDETLRARVGDGYATTPGRGGLHVVREDTALVAQGGSFRPVVGRDADVEIVVQATRTAMEGRGQVVAIRGEAGIGKTTLVREATSRMKDLPIRWYRVACRPTGSTSLSAFRDLILTYTGIGRGAAPDVVRSSLGGDRGSLAGMGLAAADQQQIVGLLLGGALGARPGSSSSGSGPSVAGDPRLSIRPSATAIAASPEVVAREGAAAVRNFLAAALRKGRVGFIVEDVQWIDAASAALLAQLASAIAKSSAVLILTARAGIWSDWNAPHFQRIQLGPLAAKAATKLLESMLHEAEVPPSVAQSILQRAGGNPLVLESIVEALRAASALRVEGGHWVLDADAKVVAEGLRGLVEARLRALEPDAQRALLLASIAGSEIDLGDLGALVGPDVDVETATRVLVGRGLLEERAKSDAGVRRVGFANEGIREVLYDMVSPTERKSLHASLAERWEAIRAATKLAPVPLEEMARHWELAGEPGPAAARLEDAAAGAASRGEFKLATTLLRRAVPHLSAVDAQTAARILVALAEAHAQSGEVQGVEQVLAVLPNVALDERGRAIAQAKGERARATANRRAGRPGDAATMLQTALDRAIAAKDHDLVCDLYLDLSAALEEANETQKALQAALTGVDAAAKLADRAGPQEETALRTRLASYLNAIGRLYLRRDDALRATDYFRGSLAQAEKVSDAAAAARALANLGNIAARRDDFRAASAESTRALRLAQQAGDRMAQARIHVNLGHYLARLGRLAEAEESYRAAQALAEAIGWSEGVAAAHQALASVGAA
jgi:serine/threonine protein kinase/tetratricopeptide (TPR) repeat protein